MTAAQGVSLIAKLAGRCAAMIAFHSFNDYLANLRYARFNFDVKRSHVEDLQCYRRSDRTAKIRMNRWSSKMNHHTEASKAASPLNACGESGEKRETNPLQRLGQHKLLWFEGEGTVGVQRCIFGVL